MKEKLVKYYYSKIEQQKTKLCRLQYCFQLSFILIVIGTILFSCVRDELLPFTYINIGTGLIILGVAGLVFFSYQEWRGWKQLEKIIANYHQCPKTRKLLLSK